LETSIKTIEKTIQQDCGSLKKCIRNKLILWRQYENQERSARPTAIKPHKKKLAWCI